MKSSPSVRFRVLAGAALFSLIMSVADSRADVCMPGGMGLPPSATPILQSLQVSCMRPRSSALASMTAAGLQVGPGSACPAGSGFRNLSSTHPPAGVVVTFNGNNLDYIRDMAAILRRTQPGLPLNILVDTTDVTCMEINGEESCSSDGPSQARLNDSVNDLQPILSAAGSQTINLIPVHSDVGTEDPTTVWAQDLANFDGVSGSSVPPQNAIFDLPYARADGVPSQVGSACGVNTVTTSVSSASAFVSSRNPYGDVSGNSGGNIEGFPGNTYVVGNTISDRLRRELQTQAGVRNGDGLIEIDTDWLNVGHADEVFNVVPTPGPGPCNFAILHADPNAAIRIAENIRDGSAPACSSSPTPAGCGEIEPPPLHVSDERNGGMDETRTNSCIYTLPHADAQTTASPVAARLGTADALGCADLIAANRAYARIISRDLQRIKAEVARRSGCARANIRSVGLPTLFRPGNKRSPWGTGDAASAINPGPVNGLVLNNTMIVPKQSNPEFERVVSARLRSVGIQPEYIDDRRYHFDEGEVHCSSNAFRTCTTP